MSTIIASNRSQGETAEQNLERSSHFSPWISYKSEGFKSPATQIPRVTKGVLQTSSLRTLQISYPWILVVHIFNLPTFLVVGYHLIPGIEELCSAERIFSHSLGCSLEGRMKQMWQCLMWYETAYHYRARPLRSLSLSRHFPGLLGMFLFSPPFSFTGDKSREVRGYVTPSQLVPFDTAWYTCMWPRSLRPAYFTYFWLLMPPLQRASSLYYF